MDSAIEKDGTQLQNNNFGTFQAFNHNSQQQLLPVPTEEKREFCLFVDTDKNYESC